MTLQPVTVTFTATLANVLYLLDRYQIGRLPVVDGRKLIGIITRADIIRAEADKLNGETGQIGPQPEPSYVVYQTRSPSVGRGRLLVPLANPQTAGLLLQMAVAIARDRHYELECIQVIIVSRHSSPSETQVRTAKSRRLLREAEILGRQWDIPVHTQIKVAHDVAQAILETIKERHIDLLLMGWKGNTITPGRIFGSVVDTLIRQAPCDVMLVRFGQESGARIQNSEFRIQKDKQTRETITNYNRWLVLMAGGPNSRVAIQLLPALVTLGTPLEIRLCQVFESLYSQPDLKVLQTALRYLTRQRKLSGKVNVVPVMGSSVTESVIDLVKTEYFDVVVLGASREGLLQQAIHGNIPAAIAMSVDITVILVRSAIVKERR